MSTHITSLPPEIMDTIHQHLMASARPEPSTAQTPPAPQYAPPTSDEAARRAMAARANFPAVSRLFNEVDKRSLSLHKNSDVGCLVTKNTIQKLAGEPAEKFKERLRALFQGNAHIDVDFSTLSPKEAATLLRVLRETVKDGKGVPLHNVRFPVDLDLEYASPELLRDIDATITAIRQTKNGKSASFEFACSSHDSARTAPPDFSSLANLTSVDLSECFQLTGVPDFSKNPTLTSVNLSWCDRLTAAPDFSKNPALRSVELFGWSLLTAAPDFSENPNLTSVDLSGCSLLTAASDFSRNPNLRSVILAACDRLTSAPDFSHNPALTSVDLSACPLLTAAPDFSQNPKLTSVELFGCDRLTAAPDFSHNPALTSVDLSYCADLATAPDFSQNPNLARVSVLGSGLPTAIVAALRELLGDRLIA